jgi:hypothetical protein
MKFFRWLKKEVREVIPVTLFFFIGFALVLFLVKLILVQYSIPVAVLSRAMIASLIVGKVVLLLEKVRLEERLPNAPVGVLVAIKTLFYGSGAIVAGFIERLIETWRESQGFGEALTETLANIHLSRFLAVIMCVNLLFGAYFTFLELDRAMGKGAIVSLFLKRRRVVGGGARE